MNISIVSSSDYECEFTLKNSSGPIANALRKTMMNHVPMLAIDKIVSIENTSVLPNEQLIQRLYFIPMISTNVDNYEMFNECKCDKDCDKCSISFSIDVKNTTKSNITVYSDDIIVDSSIVKPFKESKYGIPITKLSPGQVFIVKGFIKKGTGKFHSKWSPVGTTFYKFLPVVNIKNKSEMTLEDKKKLVQVCPVNVFSLKKGKKSNDIEDILIDVEKCTMCNECVYQFPNQLEIGYSTETIFFTVESIGSLKVDVIINNALEFLKTV